MDPKTDTPTGSSNDAPNTSAPASSPPSVGPTYDKALVYDDDGKPWREKFHGLAGRTQQLEKELNTAQQKHQNALDELQTQLGERESAIEQMNVKLTNAGEQLGALQDLKDRIPELETKARRAEKLEAILEYPTLATLQVTDTVQTDEGEEVELLVNPVMNLVQGSNLEGDALRAELRRLNSLYQKMGELPEQPQSPSVTGGAAPSPGEPVEQSAEYWEEKAAEAHKQSILSESATEQQEWIEKRTEYSQKAREARRAAAS